MNLNSSPQFTLSKDVLVRARSDPPESAPDDESEDEREFSLENPSFENSGIDTSFTDTELDDDDEDDEDDADEDEDDEVMMIGTMTMNTSMKKHTQQCAGVFLAVQAGGTTGVVLEGSEATIPVRPSRGGGGGLTSSRRAFSFIIISISIIRSERCRKFCVIHGGL